MGLSCMESMGLRYKEAKLTIADENVDPTIVFYEKVLQDYLEDIDSAAEIKITDLHKEYFYALKELKDISKDKSADQLNSEESLADAFDFFCASGLIILKNGEFYIDSEKLKKKAEETEVYKSKIQSLVYSKGSKK